MRFFPYLLSNLDRNSNDVMKEGLVTLKAICDVIDNKFEEAFEEFEEEEKKGKAVESGAKGKKGMGKKKK